MDMISKSANELELYKQCFGHLSDENNVFSQVLHVLEIVAHSRSGLGEVMQDYASQAYNQLSDIITAGRNIVSARQTDSDIMVLQNANNVMKTISRFLELTPAAMQRNNAEAIGKKEKITKMDVEKVYKTFCNSTETKLLMTYEAPTSETADKLLEHVDASVAH